MTYRIARSFRELETYQEARSATKRLFSRSQSFPRIEDYALTNQIRRSSRAVGALIAEAWARRRYEASFVHKLNEALGEAMETQAWLDAALDCGYLNAAEHVALDGAWQAIGARLARMIDRADAFCHVTTKPKVRRRSSQSREG